MISSTSARPWGERVADRVGLGLLTLFLLHYLQPALLFLPSVAAGGDTPCHYPTAAFVRDVLLPAGQVHGWYPGAYLGHPLLLYYFPLPFWMMAALQPFVGLPVAFKLVGAGGILLLPLCAYTALRLMGARFPSPLLGAAAALVFSFVEDNPIWGGTLASTLSGEFAYTWGTGLALVFLGTLQWARRSGARPFVPACALALTALAHGYAVLWAGLAATFALYGARPAGRVLRFLLAVAGLAFALAAFWLLPLLADWGWTTAYDDPWISVGWRNVLPPLLWPLFFPALAGLLFTWLDVRRGGDAERPLLLLWHAALVASALALAGPRLGVVHVRFLPFAQLALAMAGAVTIGVLVERTRWRAPSAIALVLLGIWLADSRSQVLHAWVRWNYTGLEDKPLWPAFQRLSRTLRGGVSDPRVAVEYSKEHEQAGSIRMYETLPYFSGRSTLEGVYNQASLQTHEVYYLASELSALSPNPFRKIEYSEFDTENALRHLRLFNVREIVALSTQLVSALEDRPDVERVAQIPPYQVFRLRDPGPGYVEPLAFEPVRSPLRGFREKALRWFTRKPLAGVHLVFSDDARFKLTEDDEWLPPPAVPLPGGVHASAVLKDEEIRISTDRPGHPLLVKVSYHPRWKAQGADGPYLISPALMMVIPREREVVLRYGRGASDFIGLALTLGAAVGMALGSRRGRLRATAPGEACGGAPWGGLVPAGLLLALGALAVWPVADARGPEYEQLARRARAACGSQRFVEAAEYARHSASRAPDAEARIGWQCLRGESLLSAGDLHGAARVFGLVLAGPASGSTRRALLGVVRAYEAMGDEDLAQQLVKLYRARLEREFPGQPDLPDSCGP